MRKKWGNTSRASSCYSPFLPPSSPQVLRAQQLLLCLPWPSNYECGNEVYQGTLHCSAGLAIWQKRENVGGGEANVKTVQALVFQKKEQEVARQRGRWDRALIPASFLSLAFPCGGQIGITNMKNRSFIKGFSCSIEASLQRPPSDTHHISPYICKNYLAELRTQVFSKYNSPHLKCIKRANMVLNF